MYRAQPCWPCWCLLLPEREGARCESESSVWFVSCTVQSAAMLALLIVASAWARESKTWESTSLVTVKWVDITNLLINYLHTHKSHNYICNDYPCICVLITHLHLYWSIICNSLVTHLHVYWSPMYICTDHPSEMHWSHICICTDHTSACALITHLHMHWSPICMCTDHSCTHVSITHLHMHRSHICIYTDHTSASIWPPASLAMPFPSIENTQKRPQLLWTHRKRT